jgi:REP element-mobilizing transposase RayT
MNPAIHHRRSIRLKGYDYSQAGLYFVTICVQNRQCLFGKITDGEMALNDAGKMIEKWCVELSHKFPDIMLDTYITMPNHFHAIIVNNGASPVAPVAPIAPVAPVAPVGANLRVRPNVCPDAAPDIQGEHNDIQGEHIRGEHIQGEHAGSPLHAVVQWFKTMTTNEYIRGVKTLGWQPFDKKLWQRNYYEHIIRNDNSYQNIADYIVHNPAKWQSDKFYTE